MGGMGTLRHLLATAAVLAHAAQINHHESYRSRRLAKVTPLQADMKGLFPSLKRHNKDAGRVVLSDDDAKKDLINSTSTTVGFTLVTQTSLDRVWVMPALCARWQGPIVLVMFKASPPFPPLRFPTLGNSSGHGASRQSLCGNVNVIWFAPPSPEVEYPVNTLRNLGIAAVKTSHYITIDIDFVPSASLYPTLLRLASLHAASFGDPLKAFVVPSFRIAGINRGCIVATPDPIVPTEEKPGPFALSKCQKAFVRAIPATFADMLVCASRNLCRIFDYGHNKWGHSTTDYPAYFVTRNDTLRPIKCFDSNDYEPYVVVSASLKHRYDERFAGYGKNKIEGVMHLRSGGASFAVVPLVFLVHVPHPLSVARQQWDEHKQEANAKLLAQAKDSLNKRGSKTASRLLNEFEKGVRLCAKDRRVMGAYKDTWAESIDRARTALATTYSLRLEAQPYSQRLDELMKGKSFTMPPCPEDPAQCA